MDSGWIVAGTSIATIVATGIFNLLSKKADSVQKTSEHKLTIRSVYINKKIEAGQAFIANNNIGYYSLNMFLNYLENHKLDMHSKGNEELYSKVKLFDDKLIENALQSTDYSDLYFDTVAYSNKLINLANERRLQSDKLNSYHKQREKSVDDYEEQVDIMISIIKRSMTIKIEMNELIRNDLAKYDIM